MKHAPDVAEAELEDAVGAIAGAWVDGMLATNTQLARAGLHSARQAEAEGLSGRPSRARALECVRMIVGLTGGRLPVVAVGASSMPTMPGGFSAPARRWSRSTPA